MIHIPVYKEQKRLKKSPFRKEEAFIFKRAAVILPDQPEP